MKEANKGLEPPEWMSTHPSSSKRIESLKKVLIHFIKKVDNESDQSHINASL